MTMEILIKPNTPANDGRAGEGATRDQIDGLFRSQGPRLLRFLARRTDREEARDLAQEAFLRLTRTIEDGAIVLNPGAYLQRIAANLLRDRAKSVSGAFDRSHMPLEPEWHLANDPDPHNALELRQTLDRYKAAVLKLKPKTREIFLLHRMDGLSYAQIAAETRLTVSGVEKHMIKAIARINLAMGRP